MKIMTETKYARRSLLRIILEAVTPLAVGSGEKSLLTDSVVALDVNGLPYIPATSLAGVIRSFLPKSKGILELMGYPTGKKGHGSELSVSEARLLDASGNVTDGYVDVMADPLLREYMSLPIRQHVRINDKGTHDGGGKFDNQVVYAGSRFCFEMELVQQEKDDDSIRQHLLQVIAHQAFRLGGGTRDGLGKVKIVSAWHRSLDLTKKKEMELYLSKPSGLCLSAGWQGWEPVTDISGQASSTITYKLTLQPEDMFIFGSGFGDDDAKMTPVTEGKVVWQDGKGEMQKAQTLIPATSVKGALRHRVAFHYNKLLRAYVENKQGKSCDENEAVKYLYGYVKGNEQTRGRLLFSDVILPEMDTHILNHVRIDRFTGGAIEGALFSEKTNVGCGNEVEMEITYTGGEMAAEIEKALDNAIKDIKNGMLPLGGSVNRGNGIFTGTCIKIKEGKEEAL